MGKYKELKKNSCVVIMFIVCIKFKLIPLFYHIQKIIGAALKYNNVFIF